MARKWTFKQLLKTLVVRMAIYLELMDARSDPRYKTSFIGANVHLGDAILEGNNSIGDNVELHGNVKLGFCSTLGHHDIIFGGDVSIGRYCQFAPYVAVYAINHPISYLTTYVNKRLFHRMLQLNNVSLPIQIGHDVWIGHGAIILQGTKIGNGAVVGAGAVVTKDIPDYGIAVGNPARLIKKRFDDEIITLLNRLAWWNKSAEQIEEMKDLFFVNFREERGQAIELLERYIDMFGGKDVAA